MRLLAREDMQNQEGILVFLPVQRQLIGAKLTAMLFLIFSSVRDAILHCVTKVVLFL